MAQQGKKTRLSYGSALMGILFGFMSLLLSACEKGQSQQAPPLLTVEVVQLTPQDVPVYSEWVASTDGSVNATIRPQVQGYLIQQQYGEGEFVRKGQTLFQIDPRPFQAALDQAKAEWEQAKATLEQTKADVERMEALYATAKANLKRVKPLVEQDLMSQKDLDDAIGSEQSTRAAVSAAQASMVAAQASVNAAQAPLEKARLNLGFTRVTSPIDGIAGIAKAQIGNLVGPGSVEELTTVSAVDPIRVFVFMTEQEHMKGLQNGRSYAQQGQLELILADGSIHPHKGAFAYTDRQVGERTGTIKVAALFPNPGNLLRPGQFARVRAQTMIRKGALLVPQRAVTELQGSYQVAVVGPDNKIHIRPVKVGERVGILWVIDQGLEPGEKVVVEGVQKARPGVSVNPKPFAPQATPTSEAKPPAQPAAPSKGATAVTSAAKADKR